VDDETDFDELDPVDWIPGRVPGQQSQRGDRTCLGGPLARRRMRRAAVMWLIEATRHNVLPLDDRGIERALPEFAGRPTLAQGNRQPLFGGMGRLSENSVVNIKNKSHAVTAEIVVPDGGAQGVMVAQGGGIGGWSLHVRDGEPRYCYNLLGIQRFYVDADGEIPPGTHQVRMEFAYEGGGLGKGGAVELFVDGEVVGKGDGHGYGGDGLLGRRHVHVGKEGGALVADDYPVPNDFTGQINWVESDVAEAAENTDHLISPEERLRIAMARQ
jgi:hypothetical protein